MSRLSIYRRESQAISAAVAEIADSLAKLAALNGAINRLKAFLARAGIEQRSEHV